MGGQAFLGRSPPLLTPRMPPSIYTQVLNQTLLALRQHFTNIASPIEAPGKNTFGDVDILVEGALTESLDLSITPPRDVASKLARILGAQDWITSEGNPTINFAIPWPAIETAPHMPIKEYETTEALLALEGEGQDAAQQEKKYIQIDIHHTPSPEQYHWTLFHHAHGDLWNILGTTIRPFGLTANNLGLYLRIPEIELLDRKKSMIFLTSTPSLVLEFLGLDEKTWWKPFDSQEEMFHFAAGCRMFWVKHQDDTDAEGEEGGEGDVIGEIGLGQEGGTTGKKKLKHNDRQRLSKRPIFASWISEFIPSLRCSSLFTTPKTTREEIREEAFAKFRVREEYEKRLKEWKLVRHRDELWRVVIKGNIPVDGVYPGFRAASTRVLKGVIMDGEEFDGAVPEAARVDEDGFHCLGVVKGFVMDNWEKAGEIGLERQRVKAIETMERKAEKRKREAEEVVECGEKKEKGDLKSSE